MQHVGPGGASDIGAVVDGQQRAVPAGRIGQHLQRRQLVAGLQRTQPLLAGRALVAQLDDVDPTGQRGVGEFGQVAGVTPGIGAQVEPGAREPNMRRPGDDAAAFRPLRSGAMS